MATVRCGNCGALVRVPETSEVVVGTTISQQSQGNYVLPMATESMKRFKEEMEAEIKMENEQEIETMNNMNGMNNGMNGFDMEMLVVRADLGIALHAPYDTGKRGYFNMKSFKDSWAFHLAIGYPF